MKENKEEREDKLQELLDQRIDEKSVDEILDPGSGELHMIAETDRVLKRMELVTPRSGFIARVMEQLDEVTIPRSIRYQGMIIFLGVVLVLTISAMYLGASNPDAIKLPEDVNLVGRNINLDGISSLFNASLLIKGLMFTTFLLSMFVLDKAILRPFFNKRRHISY